MLRVEVDIGGRTIDFATTHLDYQRDDGRLFETEQLLRFLADVKNPLIVVGDFNDEPAGGACKLMLTKFVDSWIGSRAKAVASATRPPKPVKRIDYIFTVE